MESLDFYFVTKHFLVYFCNKRMYSSIVKMYSRNMFDIIGKYEE